MKEFVLDKAGIIECSLQTSSSITTWTRRDNPSFSQSGMKFHYFFSHPLNWDPLVVLHHPIVQNEIINRNLDLSIISNYFYINLKKRQLLTATLRVRLFKHGIQNFKVYIWLNILLVRSHFLHQKDESTSWCPKRDRTSAADLTHPLINCGEICLFLFEIFSLLIFLPQELLVLQ